MLYNTENVIKGRIAEAIVEEMLREADYEVYRFGYESIVQNLVQDRNRPVKGGVSDTLKGMPDFLVVKDKRPYFVEVKYSKKGKLNPEKLMKKWGAGSVILAFPFSLYFRIYRIKEFTEGHDLIDLKDDVFIKVSENIIQKYGQLVVKYLGGK